MTLARTIAAIQVVPDSHGNSGLGTIAQLPQGAFVQVCGDGFNARTVKVRCQGQCYFIFREDMIACSEWDAKAVQRSL